MKFEKMFSIPLSDNFRKNFSKFFSSTETTFSDWIMVGNPAKNEILAQDGFFCDGYCDVCGSSIKNGVPFETSKGKKAVLGCACASNLLSMKDYDGEIDKMNYDRRVELEKKTLLKKKKEREKQNKIDECLEKYKKEVDFCNKIIDELYDFFPESKKIKTMIGFRNWVSEGVANQKYVDIIRDFMKRDIRKEIKEDKKKYDEIQEKKRINKKYAFKLMILEGNIRLNRFDRKFVYSLREFYNRTEFLTEKQKQYVDKMINKYRKQINKSDLDKIKEETGGKNE